MAEGSPLKLSVPTTKKSPLPNATNFQDWVEVLNGYFSLN